VGKTALALKLAEQLTPHYPDAQFYLDLKGTTSPLSPAEAMGRVVRAYYPTSKLPDDPVELQGLYRSVLHGQRALRRAAEQRRLNAVLARAREEMTDKPA